MTTTPHEPNPDDIPPTKDDDERSDKVGDDNPDEVGTPEEEENERFNEHAAAARQAGEQGAALRGFIR